MALEKRDFDWRIYGVTKLSKDLPRAGPGTSFHPAGTPIYPATVTKWESNSITFGTPSTIKIAFNIALTASYNALITKEKVEFFPHGNGLIIPPKGFPHLYDFFEQYMICVVYSFLTLEIFSNFIIDSVVGKKTVFLQLEKKPKHYSAIELQKDNISLLKKFVVILPKILDIPSIEKNNLMLWQKFKEMNILRNKITHMKPRDINRGGSIDRDSIFAEIIEKTPVNYPFNSLKIMEYYESGLTPKFWIDEMKQQYKSRFEKLLKDHEKNSKI